MISPPPIDAVVLGDDKEFSFSWKKWINLLYRTVFAIQNATVYSYNLNPSYPLQFPANTNTLQIDASGVIAAATIAMPANPIDGQRAVIASTQNITTLTLTSSYTIKNPPASMSAGVSVSYYYSRTNLTWYRLA